jgi:hypothetical protein
MSKTTRLSFVFALLWPVTLLAEVIDVTLYYVGETTGSAWAGVQQGVSEANLQGEFLGQKYMVKPVTIDEIKSVDNATAVILNLTTDEILDVAKDPHFTQLPVFNIVSDDDKLRQACLPNLLNLPVSQKMKQDALSQWQQKNPDAKVVAQGWHESFRKFAAAQLNKRFTRNHNLKMDDDAWAGWASVKMVSDTVARTQSGDPEVILDYIEHKLAFDGQKGNGATFRETGQLRQIVLLIDENNKIAAEAPLRGVKGGLDSLGLLSCK